MFSDISNNCAGNQRPLFTFMRFPEKSLLPYFICTILSAVFMNITVIHKDKTCSTTIPF